jgi:stress response protein YsnF
LTTSDGPSKAIGGDSGPEVSVPVVAEIATLRKRRVDTGRGVRITKSVIEREEIIGEPLERDELLVERVVINQVVDSDSLPQVREEGDVTIVPVFEEIVVTEKRTVLKEELRITRVRREVIEPQRVVLRREEVAVEDFDEARTSPASAPGRSTEPTAGDPAGDT